MQVACYATGQNIGCGDKKPHKSTRLEPQPKVLPLGICRTQLARSLATRVLTRSIQSHLALVQPGNMTDPISGSRSGRAEDLAIQRKQTFGPVYQCQVWLHCRHLQRVLAVPC